MNTLGRKGEELAAAYLERNGYRILARNWRCPRGEIDIIARDGNELVFVEVKTRRSPHFGPPAGAVDTAKQERLRLLARHYIFETGTTAPCYRFDVAEVQPDRGHVNIIKEAF